MSDFNNSDWILGYRGPKADPNYPRAIGRSAVQRAIADGHSKQGIAAAALDSKVRLGPLARSYLAASNIESNAAIPYTPTPGGDGIADAAKYAYDVDKDYFGRFVPSLNDQARFEAKRFGDIGSYHLSRFEGKVPDLDSSGIRDTFDYYSDKITA